MAPTASPNRRLRPRLGVVVTTWSYEGGAAYAAALPNLFAEAAPSDLVETLPCPRLLEKEEDIAGIVAYFADKALDALCLIPGNFTLDQVMPLLAEAMKVPTVLWGLPGLNAWGALVAVQQTVFPFKELGLPYRFVTAELSDAHVWERILPYVRAAALRQRLRGARVGLMGWRAEGMSDVIFDEIAIRQTFGIQLVNIGMTRYSRRNQAIPAQEVAAWWDQVCARFDASAVPAEVGYHGVRSYLAMKDIVEEEALQAVTMECFHDHLGEPCLGFAILNDAGIAAPCENDVLAAIAMLAGQLLSGEPTFHADIVEADYDTDQALFHHCGNLPPGLATADRLPQLQPIRENAGPGAFGPTIRATMRPVATTAVNLVGTRGTLRMAALEGQTVAYRTDLPGSGARVAFPFKLAVALEQLGNAGYGHHFVLVPGHVGRELAEWCKLLGIVYLQPGCRD